jgi:tetratricopeptide (TPR) repeat protein
MIRPRFVVALVAAIGMSTTIFGQDFGDHTSATLTGKAWEALGKQQYNAALPFIAKCKELYEAEALKQQAAQTDFLPADKGHSAWALNDVGTCYFIEGQLLEKQGKKADALKAYKKLASDFKFCQCWDTKGWFWHPAEAAAERVKQLDFDAALDAK